MSLSLAAGAALELLWTPMTLAITERRPLRAAVLTVAVTAVTMLGANVAASREVPDVVAYLLGTFVGCLLAVGKAGRAGRTQSS